MRCIELVVYDIPKGNEKRFLELYAWIRQEMSGFPGFVSAETLRSIDHKNTYADLWTWESVDLAKDAHARFASLPHAREFMEIIGKVFHSGHFEPYL